MAVMGERTDGLCCLKLTCASLDRTVCFQRSYLYFYRGYRLFASNVLKIQLTHVSAQLGGSLKSFRCSFSGAVPSDIISHPGLPHRLHFLLVSLLGYSLCCHGDLFMGIECCVCTRSDTTAQLGQMTMFNLPWLGPVCDFRKWSICSRFIVMSV